MAPWTVEEVESKAQGQACTQCSAVKHNSGEIPHVPEASLRPPHPFLDGLMNAAISGENKGLSTDELSTSVLKLLPSKHHTSIFSHIPFAMSRRFKEERETPQGTIQQSGETFAGFLADASSTQSLIPKDLQSLT
ncbi:hypothetical protein E2P81_ATG02966 [Venturia nashicola]|uniref:Uncharacterized protein n=1 Tax=Venturia nashicola TaxID=86259 RepID=A0A4Z1PLK3_9PEZI|nr:hypothetical protein E6O75_ATG03028 [Venturia nashicola]TLD36077.1 hypothetical protein E2P81_ATG02966 [Venturia nashicola]